MCGLCDRQMKQANFVTHLNKNHIEHLWNIGRTRLLFPETRLKVQANISSQPFPIVTADPLIVELCSALMQHRVQIPVHSWQTSPDVEPVRAKMRDQVLHIITQGKAMQSRQASEGLRNVSNAVETGLFGAASTLEE
eukprot:gene33852-40955_t